MRFYAICLSWLLLSPIKLAAQEPTQDPEPPPPAERPATPEPADAESSKTTPATPAKSDAVDREGAALRNENVFASKIDSDTQKADNTRLGGSYAVIPYQPVEFKYYGSEYGNAPIEPPVLVRPGNLANAWHGEVFESLQNSVFNARTFFQSGPVLPSRMNQYGARFTGRLPKWGYLSGTFGQNKTRGMVNGNVLVPLLSERTPLATDPAVRAVVARFLSGYPLIAPNRTDIDPHALNTNSPQRIDSTNATLRLDGKAGAKGMLSLFHDFSRQNIRAFQLVAGQNPDTAIHSQRSRIAYRIAPSAVTEFSFGANYTRLRSDLHADPTAVGPRVRVTNAESLGPQGQYPLNRAENTFRYGGFGSHRFGDGRHRITFGGDYSRYQLNGFEQNSIRGEYLFSNNFGHSGIENLLLGQATSYFVRIGNHYRGYRNWSTELYFADQWNVRPNLQIYIGLRHSLTTAPVEVNNLDRVPYDTDGNNFSPRFSFAYRAPRDWIARGSYSVQFGEIFPVTYSQIRFNPPIVQAVNLNNPYLADPLAGIDLSAVNPRASLTSFSPDLATPYSHQYSFTLEHSFGPLTLSAAYVGSRSFKVLSALALNRARIIPGVPLTTATINDRRPDKRYFDIIQVANAGIAYLDAAQLSWRFRAFHGFAGGGTYTWSKALDQGSMYNSTAANNDLFGRGQSEFLALQDQKGLSQFDSPHSLAIFGTEQTPALKRFPKPASMIGGNWQISGIVVAKTGTPFTVSTGSDAPGFGNVDGTGGDRPNILNPSILHATVGNPNTSQQILKRSYFSFISPGQLAGNIGTNTFRKGPIFNLNASVAREWRWGMPRSYTFRFQADAYNLMNHAQFDAPQLQLSSPSFGRITNTLNNGRVLQFGVRFVL